MAEDGDEEEADGTDSEAEEEIWKAMKRSMPKARGNVDDDGDEDIDIDDDDEDLAQFDYSDSEVEGEGGEDDVPFKSAFGDEEDGIDDDGDDGFVEDEDDLVGSDEDMPMFLGGGDDSDEEVEEPTKGKKKGSKKEDRKNKKRKLSSMPVFATADDYAHLLGDSDEDDV